MRAFKIMIAGGAGAAALFAAAPAAAQYYPGPGYGYPGYGSGGNVVGQVINQVLGGGYNGYGGYGMNSQAVVNQCAAAVQQRITRDYGYGGYNPYGGYGQYGGGYGAYGQAGGARVLGISRVEPRSSGGLTVRGVATTGLNAGYGYGGYAGQGQVDLTWKCKTDYRGFISDIDVERARTNYGQNYTPYGYDYSQYGYRRY
jgi:hypothetical protein